MRTNSAAHAHHQLPIHGYLVEELEVEEIILGPIQLPDAQKTSVQALNCEGRAGHFQH